MVVLLYGVELDVLNSLETADRDKFMREAADAYRERSRILRAKGRLSAAQADGKRAANLEAEAKKLASAAPTDKGPSPQLKDLAKQIEELRKKVNEALEQLPKSGERSRQANFGPTQPDDGSRIELVNAWGSPVTVILDGTTYALRPGESRTVVKRAGPFTYEVRDIQTRVTREVKAAETYTIRIGPR